MRGDGSGFQLFDDPAVGESSDDEELPKDEVGRQKIKSQYYDLLGIRMQKLCGRILNRERINKTLEGIYFICVRCEKVCHNLDEGLVEDENNEKNMCVPCSKLPAAPPKSAEPPAPRPKKRVAVRRAIAAAKATKKVTAKATKKTTATATKKATAKATKKTTAKATKKATATAIKKVAKTKAAKTAKTSKKATKAAKKK
jgi:type IV secretory pathway VirB10-like protein